SALEEERRLAYVGLTRARKRVFISFAANRRVHNQWRSALPSRFIDELPSDRVTVTTGQGLYRGGQGGGGGLAEAGNAWGPPRRARRAWRGGAANVAAETGSGVKDGSGAYAVGARVFHQKFGYGRVLAVDGDQLEVAFDKAGTKKVVDSFLQPA
ncbi:MAG: 3'-5' exonuclease, partial [Alphaproteobacteria bacterium]